VERALSGWRTRVAELDAAPPPRRCRLRAAGGDTVTSAGVGRAARDTVRALAAALPGAHASDYRHRDQSIPAGPECRAGDPAARAAVRGDHHSRLRLGLVGPAQASL